MRRIDLFLLLVKLLEKYSQSTAARLLHHDILKFRSRCRFRCRAQVRELHFHLFSLLHPDMLLRCASKRFGVSSRSISFCSTRLMATVRSSLPHTERTASEPRENTLEPVILANVREVNESIRLFRLNAVDQNHTIKVSTSRSSTTHSVSALIVRLVKFLPGQWLDTFIPGLPKAGGFTITSTPSEAKPSTHSPPYLELAVQKSSNPPAEWLWQTPDRIIGTQLHVRVGGSFTWPPQRLNANAINRVVLIAGGVGIKSASSSPSFTLPLTLKQSSCLDLCTPHPVIPTAT